MRILATFVLLFAGVACGAAPKSESGQQSLETQARATLSSMMTKDATLRPLLTSSAGYVVFPNIGKGGFIAGGAYGRGVLYENGRPTGFVQIQEASFGAQVGAQSFSELIVFRNKFDIERLKHGTYSLGANASAVVLTAGGAASATTQPVAVFVQPRGGVMAELSISGQRLSFQRG